MEDSRFEEAACPKCGQMVKEKMFVGLIRAYYSEYIDIGMCPQCQDIYYKDKKSPTLRDEEPVPEEEEDEMSWWGGDSVHESESICIKELDRLISKPVCMVFEEGVLKLPKCRLASVREKIWEEFPDLDILRKLTFVETLRFFGFHSQYTAHCLEIMDIDSEGEFLFLHKILFILAEYILTPTTSHNIDFTFGDGSILRFIFQSQKLYCAIGKVQFTNKKLLKA